MPRRTPVTKNKTHGRTAKPVPHSAPKPEGMQKSTATKMKKSSKK